MLGLVEASVALLPDQQQDCRRRIDSMPGVAACMLSSAPLPMPDAHLANAGAAFGSMMFSYRASAILHNQVRHHTKICAGRRDAQRALGGHNGCGQAVSTDADA